MPASVTTSTVRRHLLSSDIETRMAKATYLRDPKTGESPDWREKLGRSVDRARQLRGWNLDELADAVKRDARQVARWIAGTERPQFDALFAVESLRQPLVIALAEVAQSAVEIETTIRIRREVP